MQVDGCTSNDKENGDAVRMCLAPPQHRSYPCAPFCHTFCYAICHKLLKKNALAKSALQRWCDLIINLLALSCQEVQYHGSSRPDECCMRWCAPVQQGISLPTPKKASTRKRPPVNGYPASQLTDGASLGDELVQGDVLAFGRSRGFGTSTVLLPN
jgi:hypothetical protein